MFEALYLTTSLTRRLSFRRRLRSYITAAYLALRLIIAISMPPFKFTERRCSALMSQP